MLLGVDQGAIITVDGGNTWSSWYNQPTGQFYHVSTDNVFPYHVYAAQQDSGSVAVLSRSDYGEILQQDWYSPGAFEAAFISPDPAHPNLIYSNGWYSSVVRLDTNTGQLATVFEKGQKYRAAGMAPLVFSTHDPSTLYLGMQHVLKTHDGAKTWQEISPDLTAHAEKEEAEDLEPGAPKPPSISALSPSPLAAAELWAGTSNRLVYLTLDSGSTWKNVTPPGLGSPNEWQPNEVLYVEASHHDPAVAFLTIGASRDFTPPNVLRTRDYGQSWQKIVNGFPLDEMVRVVREDPKRKGLLYAGTDTGVFISWDEGDHWQPFSLNLPASPVTDLTVHGNDLAISTYGRGLWILDDVTPLREFKPEVAAADVYLFPPATAMRVRWQNYQDTPYPIETPAGENPPDGAIVDYFLKAKPASELTLTIYDEKNSEVATFSSQRKPEQYMPANVPDYWFAPPAILSTTPGVNRIVWDFRYPPPATLPYSYYGQPLEYAEYTFADHAVPGHTPRPQPRGPLAPPGKYTVVLRSGEQELRQPLTIGIDPRVPASAIDLQEQGNLALALWRGMKSSHDSFLQVLELSKALTEAQKSLPSGNRQLKDVTDQLAKQIATLEKGPKSTPGFGSVNRDMGRLIYSLETADLGPTEAVRSAIEQSCSQLEHALLSWEQLNAKDLPALNAMLAAAKLLPMPLVNTRAKGCKE